MVPDIRLSNVLFAISQCEIFNNNSRWDADMLTLRSSRGSNVYSSLPQVCLVELELSENIAFYQHVYWH